MGHVFAQKVFDLSCGVASGFDLAWRVGEDAGREGIDLFELEGQLAEEPTDVFTRRS